MHPFIHLGFGLEFEQPAIIAEALGQTLIHPTWLDSFFLEVDQAAKESQEPHKFFVSILDEIRADKKLSAAAEWGNINLIRDGVLAKARDEMAKYASQWRVRAEDLEAATAEVANAAGK